MKALDYPQDISISEGLYGFEDYTKWTLQDSVAAPFMELKCAIKGGPSFFLLDPFLVCKDYEIDIDDSALQKIGVEAPKDILVLTIVTIAPEGKGATVNLAGPLIINRLNGKAMQIIVADPRYTTKYDIVAALAKDGTPC